MIIPFLTITQPTAGFGDVVPIPLRARLRARFMYFVSVAVIGNFHIYEILNFGL
jgi:hypothetical protein